MFHAQFSWNKKRVKTETEKAATNVPKMKYGTIIYYQSRKRLQTSNKSVLGVFPIYKVRARTTYIENICKGGFMRVQRCKDRENR